MTSFPPRANRKTGLHQKEIEEMVEEMVGECNVVNVGLWGQFIQAFVSGRLAKKIVPQDWTIAIPEVH
jgi:hypothetical protein